MEYDIMPIGHVRQFYTCIREKKAQHSWKCWYEYNGVPSMCIPPKRVTMYITLTGDYLYVSRQARDGESIVPVYAGYMSSFHDFREVVGNYCSVPDEV